MVWVLSNEVEYTPFKQILLNSRYSFDCIFSGLVWIDRLHNRVEGIYFNETGNRKKTLVTTKQELDLFLLFVVVKRKKHFNEKNLVNANYY